MAINICKDLQLNQDVKAVYFDGTANSIANLQKILSGSSKLNLNTLHTKIGLWAVRYKDGSIVWKKQKCFNTNYKVVKEI